METDCDWGDADTLILDKLSDSESADTAVDFHHIVLKRPATTDEIVDLSRYIRQHPNTIDRANARVERLRIRETRYVRSLDRQSQELRELKEEKAEALQQVAKMQDFADKYKDAKRKLKVERDASETMEELYSKKMGELRAKLWRREEELKHKEETIASLRRQIGNAGTEFGNKFPGRQISIKNMKRKGNVTNSSCEAVRGSTTGSTSTESSLSESSSSSVPSSDVASITAVRGSPVPSRKNKDE